MSRILSVFFATLALSAAATAHAEPIQLAAQGRLTSAGGSPVADGGYALGVAIYDVQTGGAPLWNEAFLSVPVQGGVFAVTLGGALSKLDSGVLASGKTAWIGVTVGADPELPRQPLLRVPSAVHAMIAAQAADLQCTGCVGSDDIAKAAITGEKIAKGAVDASHVSFAWAGAESAGGAATFALGANTAKLADAAKNAENAAFADEAASAKGLQCTGCITAKHLHDKVAEDLVAGGKLAKVATSGKYADLQGGPDLSGYGALAAANKWTQPQELAAGGSLDAALNFNANEAKLLRLQNVDKDPIACDSKAIGVVYYNTATSSLMVCNGKQFAAFAYAIAVGSDQKAPGQSCLDVQSKAGAKTDGLYWIDPNGGSNADAFQAYCDMTKDGGGWTRVMSAKWKFFFGDTNWNSHNQSAPMDPNYSILNHRDYFKKDKTYTFRLQVGQTGDWTHPAIDHFTVWTQDHDPFTAASNGSDFKHIAGTLSSTCGNFNGLHNKYTTYSYTCDPDTSDADGCWWMQIVPKKDYNNSGYLEGWGGSGNYHNWQVLWIR